MANISVIIPLFNNAKYVTRAIDSVLAQSYQDFELVVVDDGSIDSGPELVQKYQNPRLRLVRQQNEGPGSARNRGIQETTAPYLAFLDADDEWLPNFLSRYLDALSANPNCDYVVGPWFEGDPRVDKSETWKKFGVEESAWRLPADVSHTHLHKYLTMLHWTGAMLCKRHAVERYGGFYSKGKCTYGEDRYLQLQLLLNHQMYRVLEPLAWYHNETIGISSVEAGPRPLWPLLTDPELIRKNCPQPFCEVLEWYLASHALGYAQECVNANDLATSFILMRRFPLMRKFRRKFAQLLMGISLAKAVIAFTGRPKDISGTLP